MSRVLVTGGSGFVGSRCILQLLALGHEVRTTVRTLARENEVRALLKAGGADPGTQLQLVVADLMDDAGWAEAVRNCEYVLHVASPFPAAAPKHEDELIVPAREGTLRVLRAARDAGVKRVVVTSSFAAIGYGHAGAGMTFDESFWTDISQSVPAYHKSKTLAERAAWDFIEEGGGGLELSVINPVGIFGPVLGPDLSSSIQIVKAMLEGRVRHCPQVYFGVVDVRDVADLHIFAMTHPAAKGERFLAAAGDCIRMFDIARILRSRLGAAADKAPRRELPNWQVRVAALFSQAARQTLPELGKVKHLSNEKARRVLGWNPRSNEEAIVSTAESLIQQRLLSDSAGDNGATLGR